MQSVVHNMFTLFIHWSPSRRGKRKTQIMLADLLFTIVLQLFNGTLAETLNASKK